MNANQSAPTIVTLADLSSVRVKAKISEADVVNLKVGLPVYFNIIGRPDKKYQATLSTIGPAPDGTTASDSSTSTDSAIYYIGYFTVPNPDGALRINIQRKSILLKIKSVMCLAYPLRQSKLTQK